MATTKSVNSRSSVRESPRKRKRVQYDEDSDGSAEAVRSQQAHPKKGAMSTSKRPTINSGLNSTTKSQKAVSATPKKKRSQKVASIKSSVDEIDEDKETPVESPSVSHPAPAKKGEKAEAIPRRKSRTKEEKAANMVPLATRSAGLKMFVGSHVSIAKGLENSVTNCLRTGGNAFALFLKSQRKWENPPLKSENRDAFKDFCHTHQYDAASHVLPHGSYLVNLATPDKDKSKQSYETFLDDLQRCEQLGIKYYNFHPGNTNQEPLDQAIGRLAANLNKALAATSTVVPVLENMAGGGSVIGSRFTDLRDIIALIKPDFRSRIGICIDTCHAFAAGYDLRDPEAYRHTFEQLDNVVGLKYLKAMHLNDSKGPLGSKRDLHQNIGVGFLGLRAFHNIMNDERLQNLPLILETPQMIITASPNSAEPSKDSRTLDDTQTYAREIKLLESLIGMDPESEEFKKLEADLSKRGEAERKKMQASVDVKEAKLTKKLAKEQSKTQKTVTDMFGGGKKKRRANSSSSTSDGGVNGEAE